MRRTQKRAAPAPAPAGRCDVEATLLAWTLGRREAPMGTGDKWQLRTPHTRDRGSGMSLQQAPGARRWPRRAHPWGFRTGFHRADH